MIPKISKIYPRDIIAVITLIACFILIASGINHVVSGIAIMIVTYYFSKRVYEEKNPNGDINQKVEKLEEDIKKIPKTSPEIPKREPKEIKLHFGPRRPSPLSSSVPQPSEASHLPSNLPQ